MAGIYTYSILLALILIGVPCLLSANNCGDANQGNAVQDLKLQFASLQSKIQSLQEENTNTKRQTQRLQASLDSTTRKLQALEAAQAKMAANIVPAAFMARKTDVQSVSAGTLITFRQAIANHGGLYSTSTSKFTCRDHNVYVFMATILSAPGSPTYFVIVQDGHARGSGYSGSGGLSSATEMAVIKCHPGSKVWVKCHSNYNVNGQKAWHHSYFAGFRV